MDLLRITCALGVTAVLWTPSYARFEPWFSLDGCAWAATHIVVATELDRSAGKLKIIESWKGTVGKGKCICIPELSRLGPADLQIADDSLLRGGVKKVRHPAQVTGSRIVLFLIESSQGKPGRPLWHPANPDWKTDMKASVAWIEAGRVYAFEQRFNPGPSQIRFKHITETEAKARVRYIVELHDAFDVAVAKADGSGVSKALLPILRVNSPSLGDVAIDKVGQLGPRALPVLRTVLEDNFLSSYHASAVMTMVRAGGKGVAPQLIRLAEEDLLFWERAAPRLADDWYEGSDDVPQEATMLLQERYYRTQAVLDGLKATAPAGSRGVVTGLRDLWRTQPALAKHADISKNCEAVLTAIRLH